ncbi:hypothetical protein F5984_24470 [Rudanella paleaurantiibacter]|uniref:Uncharacterized protein n=1 Tax=Rudanella paleaurantiibacter TaxID=2614655 RepID=A0A7J5TSS6_9BACT|nr:MULTISPECIES: hypothetical protein [Rudanella]KAB7726476.1 hypothetical protein F5984_24470 [Rudanella paleaurantiibacter]
MLLIEEGQQSHLPKKYRPVNNLCAVIYDQFTSILTQKHFLEHINVEIAIDPANQQFVEDLQNGSMHALDFMKANGQHIELAEILTKHITLSVLSDFANFMYESLSCAQRGKMTVAYALLRKPLTDELVIFERLLTNPAEFIQLYFHVGNPKGYDPSEPNLNRQQIIQEVFRMANPGPLFVPDLVYGLRYDKHNPAGINGISNQALHIVTNHPAYRTEEAELNFVFSNYHDYRRYWRHYYYFVPYLLIYAAHVVDELVFSWMPGYEHLKAVRAFQRFVGTLFWSKWMQGGGRRTKASQQLLMQAISESLSGICDQCGKDHTIDEADLTLFFNEQLLLCPHCLCNHMASEATIERIMDLVTILHGGAEA